MPSTGTIQTAIRVTASLIGAATAGPLGAALGGMASAALAKPTEDLAKKSLEKLLDLSADQLAARFDQPSLTLQSAYRNALQQSLATLAPQASLLYSDWFHHWNLALTTASPLDLAPLTPADLQHAALDILLRRTLETLDAQGRALQQQSLSITLPTRPLPEDLFTLLATHLPPLFEPAFRTLLTQPAYAQAWAEAQQHFQDWLTTTLTRIDTTTQSTDRKVDRLLLIAEALYADNELAGRAPADPDLKAKEAEIARMKQTISDLEAQLAARPQDPLAARIQGLIETGDTAGALALKQQQAAANRLRAAAQEAQDLFEFGQIYELRFDWPQALDAYRKAWQLSHNPAHGFKYAFCAAYQKQSAIAIQTYEQVYELYKVTMPSERAARTLNNLGILYCKATHRIQDAEQALTHALNAYRTMAETDPDAFLPAVASTLNNRAILYKDTQRLAESERDSTNALASYRALAQTTPDAFLSEIAGTLDNLANIYSKSQRPKLAEDHFAQAITIRRRLAAAAPQAFLPELAAGLSNLGILYTEMHRGPDAEKAYNEAISILRDLCAANPAAFRAELACTLNNLGVLLGSSERAPEARQTHAEALAIRRQLAAADPNVYRSDLSVTLNNLGLLNRSVNPSLAGDYYREALAIRRELVAANRDSFLPDLATTLNNLGVLYGDIPDVKQSGDNYREALAIRRTLATQNPEVYQPDVATTLTDLAIMVGKNDPAAALESSREALAILSPFHRQNPQRHGDAFAKTLCTHALLLHLAHPGSAEPCTLARQALRAALSQRSQAHVQSVLQALCPTP